VAVKLHERTSPDRFAAEHGLAYHGRIANLSNYHLFRRTAEYDPTTHTHPAEHPDAEWVQHQTKRQLGRRDVVPNAQQSSELLFTDPEYDQQWHWNKLSLAGAWQRGYTGAGVTISVLDDGLDAQHPDLVDGYSYELSYDVNGQRKVPRLGRADVHGTPAAGLAVARDNSVCGVGSAYRASVAAVRLVSEQTTDAEEAQGIAYGAPDIDV
jgi:subtilisin family serine protease